MNKKKTLLSAITWIAICLSTNGLSASTLFEPISLVSKLEYQQAAAFSHLNWLPVPGQPISIQVLPINNFSGIPLQLREEQVDYFNHGKIPQDVQWLFSDLVSASRYFRSEITNPDYRFQLSIEQYQLPFDYAPDDIWWKKLNANVDRWFATTRNARVKLSLRVTSATRRITPWTQSIETTLSYCDLNATSQPLTSKHNQNQTINQYVQTTPGQAFVAASNYLILQAVKFLNQKPEMARVIRNDQNEIFIESNGGAFVLGELLGLYYQQHARSLTALPAGQLQIIKTYENQAVAYPVNLRIDQIKAGDWVELSEIHPFVTPKSIFSAKNQCAQVSVAKADKISSKF